MADTTSMGAVAHSKKELLWLACREKTCCHNTRVILSGQDMWRISQSLELDPWDYTLYVEAEEGAVGGFQLAPNGPLYQVVLAKQGEIGPKGAPCIFLWKLPDGHAQCGLGGLRPLVCQTYPALLAGDMLMVESGSCSCRRWSTLDLDPDTEVPRLNKMLEEAAEYSEIAEAWNRNVRESAEHERSYPEFCSYVLDAYRQRCGETY